MLQIKYVYVYQSVLQIINKNAFCRYFQNLIFFLEAVDFLPAKLACTVAIIAVSVSMPVKSSGWSFSLLSIISKPPFAYSSKTSKHWVGL